MQRLPASCRLETGRAAPSSLSFCTLVGPMIDHACLRLPSLPLRYRYLLLCGSVVIYVREGMQHKEFYEYGLLPGVHYVAVDTAADVPAMVRWLKQHDDYARAVALAGRARMATLDIDAVADFMAELLSQYARKQTFRPRPAPGAVRIQCEDDLWRHYARDPGWMNHYLSEDNATCITPPPASGLGPPGWGGAYAGSSHAASPLTTYAALPSLRMPVRQGTAQGLISPVHPLPTSTPFPGRGGAKEPFDWEAMQWKALQGRHPLAQPTGGPRSVSYTRQIAVG